MNCLTFWRAGLAVASAGFAITFPLAAYAQLPAFPGAQGFGRFAAGGRGGTVYHVTNLNDSGPGSFREAVSGSGRTVVFDVGGVIAYTGSRYNIAPNVTIAGQTAPGDGVTLYGDGIGYTGSHNTITRFIRYRMGINGDSDADAVSIASGHDMIFDHITASWGRDETFSISGSDPGNITIQSSIISQGLQGHSAGGLVQTDGGVSILRTLYIDNDTRNPKVKGVSEYVNNVVCNWETIGYNMGGDSAGESFVNVFNNYFMRGPASGGTAIGGGNTDFHIYATNNWYDGDRDGILDGSNLPFASYGSMDLKTTPYPYPISFASAHSPLTALKLAISDAGPSFRRDSVDEQLITELTSWGELGGTITSELIAPMNGPGLIRNGTPYLDTDKDGMPDFWESGTGSNPAVANNNDASPSGSGYTRLEDYLNWLAEPHGIALQNTNVVVDLRQFTRGWVIVNHSPIWSVSNPTNGTAALTNGYLALFTPAPGLNGPASFAFTVNDADGSPVTRTMNLFFTPGAQSHTPVWHGDDLSNTWNALGDFDWHDGISLLYQFHQGDAVLFDDTGSTAPAVNLSGSLQPASVTINATKNYNFIGGGSLDGTMTLNKTNSGTLTIHTTNSYTGNTTVSNGTLLVHGALSATAVTIHSAGAVGGNGQLGNSLMALSGSTIVPGNGIGSPGTLTITNTLTLSGGVTNRFDLSDDPSGTTKTNDFIRVIGNLNLSGVNVLKFSLLDGLPGNGVYTLITYSGTLSGGLANFSLSGISGTLTNPPGAISIIVNATRPPAALTWTGNGGNNFWDSGTTMSWNNDGVADRFYFLDEVLFHNTGSSNLTANLVGELAPSSVTVDATVNYTLTGAGKITGTTGLTKSNSGTLTILTTNDFTGPTVIGGGTLSVSRLANAGAASGIGAAIADSANLIFSGSRLSYTGGSATSDRGATFNGNANFDLTSAGTTLTWNGTNLGSGALIKSGPGTLTLTAENSFSGGTILSNGTLALFGPTGGASITANNYALGSGSVTLYGGTLKLFGGDLGDAGAGYGSFSRPLIVPAGATATILTPARYTMNSPLSGGGTLNLEVNYVRGSLNGNWSAFTGTINVTAQSADSEFRVTDVDGYAGATIFLNAGAVITQSGSGGVMDIGALGGTSGSRVGPGNQTSSGRSFRIGWNHQNATFAGQILADGVNTVTKVGTGNWTLTGANTYTGGTVVNGGTLTVNNTSGSATGTGSVAINTGTTLTGSGIISGAVIIASGAALLPGHGGVGTLAVNNSVTLNAGSTTRIEINKTSGMKDLVDASGALTYGGNLIVTNLSGTLTNGDSFKIFDAALYVGSFSGINLPPLAPDLIWYTGTLTNSGTISVVSTNFTGPQPLVWKGDGVSNLWDTATSNWLAINGVPRAFANVDAVTFNDAGSNSPAVNLSPSLTPTAVTVNANKDYTFSGSGVLSGTMALVKSGTGKLTLNNLHTFTGGTTINGGSLQLGDGISLNGNLSGSITNHAALIFANSTALTTALSPVGSGTLTKTGSGVLTLSANQSYTNLTIINSGTLEFSGTPPAGNISNNAALVFEPASSLTYAGRINGTGSVNLNASGRTLTLNGASAYSGGTTNTAGTLRLAGNTAAGSGPVTYLAGAVHVGNNVVVTNTFLVPSSTADSMMDCFSGSATWAGDILLTGGGAQFRPSGINGTLVLTGNGALGGRNLIVPRGTVEFAGNAVFSATGGATAFGRNSTGNSVNVRVRNNASLSFGALSMGGGQGSGGTLTLTIQDNASFSTGINNFDLHNSTAAAAVTVLNLNGGTLTVGGFTKTRTGATQFTTNNFNGGRLRASQNNASFLPGFSGLTTLVKAGGAVIDDNGFSITTLSSLAHDPALGATSDGGLTKLGSGTVTISYVNTYTGPTIVHAGTLRIIAPPTAPVLNTSNVYVAAGAVFDLSPLGSFTFASGRKVRGNGSLKGNLVFGSGAILDPGSNAIGGLTFSNAVTFASGSTNLIELSRSLFTNDFVKVFGALTNGGALIVTNLAGAFAVGDSFRLFAAASYSGAFSAVVLPELPASLAWNTNQLNPAGIISVISTAPVLPPAFRAVVFSGGNLVMSGSDGPASGSYHVLAATNVALPLPDWTRLLTNQFDASGNFIFTNPISVGGAQHFFRLETP